MPNAEWTSRDAAIVFGIIVVFLATAIYSYRVSTAVGVMLTFVSAWFVFGFTYWTMRGGEE